LLWLLVSRDIIREILSRIRIKKERWTELKKELIKAPFLIYVYDFSQESYA
jgi:hypothetical protein